MLKLTFRPKRFAVNLSEMLQWQSYFKNSKIA